jgi:hypothetical protein
MSAGKSPAALQLTVAELARVRASYNPNSGDFGYMTQFDPGEGESCRLLYIRHPPMATRNISGC